MKRRQFLLLPALAIPSAAIAVAAGPGEQLERVGTMGPTMPWAIVSASYKKHGLGAPEYVLYNGPSNEHAEEARIEALRLWKEDELWGWQIWRGPYCNHWAILP